MKKMSIALILIASTITTATEDHREPYADYAENWVASSESQNTEKPHMRFYENSVGRLSEWSVSVIQVIDEKTALCELDVLGTPEDISFMLSGSSTKNWTDGKNLKILDEAIFAYAGTVSYTTVLGAKRTVHKVVQLDGKLLKEAIAAYQRQKQLNTRSAIQTARSELLKANGVLAESLQRIKEHKTSNRVVLEYIDVVETIAIYSQARHSNEQAKIKYDRAVARKMEIGEIDKDEIKVYTLKLGELNKKASISRINQQLAKLRFDEMVRDKAK